MGFVKNLFYYFATYFLIFSPFSCLFMIIIVILVGEQKMLFFPQIKHSTSHNPLLFNVKFFYLIYFALIWQLTILVTVIKNFEIFCSVQFNVFYNQFRLYLSLPVWLFPQVVPVLYISHTQLCFASIVPLAYKHSSLFSE